MPAGRKGLALKHAKALRAFTALVLGLSLCACAVACSSGQPSQEAADLAASQPSQAVSNRAAVQSSQQESEQSSQQSAEQLEQEFSARTRTWIVVGDSLTVEHFKAWTKYYDYVAMDLGCTVVNCGAIGTGYMTPMDGDSFFNRVDSIDVSEADCLTIFGSFNDLGKGYYLGSAYDETEYTIGGCMNLTIQKLVDKNPALKIGIVTPTPWRTNFSYNEDGSASFDTITRADCDAYVALLKEVAKRHRLPVLDLYETCGLDPDSEQMRQVYYTYNEKTDEGGVHPNSAGHKRMYPMWREFVKTLIASDAVDQ